MSWRETIKSRSNGRALVGSFRGAEFVVPNSEASVGRRAVVHEYPLRDVPWVEDMGRKARKFTCDVFVDDSIPGGYLAARDALIQALEKPGDGSLVHPWYGTMRVTLAEPATVRESTNAGGRASFRLVFVEAGELRFPTAGADTQGKTDAGANAALAAAKMAFGASYNISGMPDWSITELTDDLYNTMAQIEKMITGVTAAVAAEIRSPGNLSTAIIGAVQSLAHVATPTSSVSLYRQLFTAGDDSPAAPATTATRRQQATNSGAMHRLVQQTAVIEAARSSSQVDYQTSNDALATTAVLEDALDTQMEAVDPVSGEPVDDQIYQALADLRVAVVQDLRTRGARLPILTDYEPLATLPSLVLAHRLYGDAGRAAEIIARNRIVHPGFVPGGKKLEVLNA